MRRREMQELPAEIEQRHAESAGGGPVTATPEHRARYKAHVRECYGWLRRYLCCADCGRREPEVKLEFHHDDPDEKDLDISTLVTRAHSVQRIMREVLKTRPLCQECHARAEGRASPAELRRAKAAEGVETDG
jgi:hypothetical protein